MADIKEYQSSVNWESPEAQAKKRALKNAWIPQDIKIAVERSRRSSETKSPTSNQADKESTAGDEKNAH